MLEHVNLEELSEAELMELNRRVVQRLRLLHELRTHENMLKFSAGERVAFHSHTGENIRGVISRYNRKTVTVITDSGQRWNVSPSLLRKDAVDTEKAADCRAHGLQLVIK